MRARQAADVVNRAAFHPDYKLTATPLGIGLGEDVVLEIAQRTYDSSTIDASGDYWMPVRVGPVYDFDAAPMETDDDVLFAVLGKLREFHEHEDREFLRTRRGGVWTAPFHPHNSTGNRAWDARARQAERTAAR